MKVLPTRESLMMPVLNALKFLGGSGTVDEITNRIISDLKIPEHLATIPQIKGNDNGRTKLEYELAWVRTMLKSNGYIDSSKRGVWVLRDKEFDISTQLESFDKDEFEAEREDWKENILRVITEKVSPDGFERLIQRMLREKGFSEVEVTGRTGDGGIDGKGIAKINGILSFHVVFQCKRYKGSVSASHIRDFRGAMVGRTDKGLFITTGYFTRDALKEASRDGAPAIDLIDGEKLAEKLKELSLGVNVAMIEKVTVDEQWFNSI